MKSKELNEKTTICAQPWFGVVVKSNGTAGICCEVTDELKGLDIRKNTFKEFQNHPRAIEIRAEMLAGQKPKECWRCWEKEAQGASSLRHSLNQTYELRNGEFDPEFVAPQSIEFVLGNLCQLRCVMCHPARSKKIQEAFDHIIKVEFRNSYKGLVSSAPKDFNTDWVEDESLWDSLAQQSLQAKRIYINGGEPLLAKQHEKVLRKLIDAGISKEADLVYSTNGLLLDESHIEMWQNFREVNVSFSIDDLMDRNAFIRHPSNWGQVESALERVKRWKRDPKNSHITIGIWCAMNILSYPYMPEYLEYFATNHPELEMKGIRAVQTPEYLNPSNLPIEFKQQVTDEIMPLFDKYPQFSKLKEEFNYVLNTRDNPYLMVDGISYMKRNAEFYGVDLWKTFPKMTDFLNHRNT